MNGMQELRKSARGIALLGIIGLLSACGGGGGGGGGASNAATGPYSVGGLVSGLTGSVILQNNGGDNLTIAANGTFTFATPIANGNAYNVTVLTQPMGQTCSVSTGAGTVSGSVVSNVTVVCSTNTYGVGGAISGLAGSVVLQDNNGDNLTVATNGAFTFTTQVANGSPYNVTVLTQPAGQNCSVANGTGTISAANVTSVVIICSTNTYTLSGTVTGLNGSVVLQNNGGNNLTVSANGTFTFAAAVPYGSTYSVTVLTQPAGQTCSVTSGSGTISGNVSNVAVACTNNFYTIGGSMIGLVGSVVLQNNGGDNLTVASNGTFTFVTPIVNGSTYNVTILTQPVGQTCSVNTGAGTISAGNVGNVLITCSTIAYSVGGAVSGLTGSVVLQDNNGDNLTVAANGTFTFVTKVANGSPYSISVLTQPAGQNCSVANGTGTISAANVANVAITCAVGTYTISGTISGLNGSVVLQNNGGNNLTVAANGTFTFAATVSYGSVYNVTVLTQPAGQTCVSYGSGTVSGNVTNVAVVCKGNPYTVGGSVTGLVGYVILQNNGSDYIFIGSNGAFTFLTPILNGNTYNVTVISQPIGQTCSVSGGAGTISGANVSNVAVVCAANPYSVGGSISGLTGSVVLHNNNGDNLTVTSNGSFAFAIPVADGSTYGVTVLIQPTGQSCSVVNGTGTVAGASVTNVSITCATNTYTIGGTVTGLNGSMVLQDNGSDNLTVAANGSFTFATTVAYGNPYNVTVSSLQNANQTCYITGGSGTAKANVISVALNCVPLALVGISPTTVTAGGQPFVITALGTGYLPTSVVQWNGTARTTTYVSPTELLAQITAADIAAPGTASVTIANPAPQSGVSPSVQVTIAPPSKDAVAFQLDATHSGVINFNAVSLPVASKWSVNLGGAPSYALIAGGKVFVTVYFSGTGNSQLIALDQATGATAWGPIAIAGTANAAYDSGIVFALSNTITSPQTGLMQAFDAVTGQLKWSKSIGMYPTFSPPTAANGFVYMGGASSSTLYAVSQSNGAIAWTQPIAGGYGSIPAVSTDGVYVAFPCQTYAFRPNTGESIWWSSTGCSTVVGATPVVANGVVYSPNNSVGTYSGNTFNAETGTLLGSYVADHPPAIGSQTGYFLQSGTLRGITLATNTVLWSFAGDGLLVTSPVVVNSYVFVGSSSGNLYAVNAASGAQVWNMNVGAAIPTGAVWGQMMQFSALAAGDGLLVVPAGNTLTAYTLSIAP